MIIRLNRNMNDKLLMRHQLIVQVVSSLGVFLSASDKEKLLAALQRRQIEPKVINLDDALRDLSPEITKYLEENYESVHVGRIRVRKTDSLP